jgi:DUF1365 family protein
MTASALYMGKVVHARTRPRRHRLSYRVFWLLLDLDEIDALDRRLRLFSHNRWNLVSFHDRDHGARGTERRPLRAQIETHLRAAGIETDRVRITLLTMPRILGYVFNPLSIYFCRAGDGALAAIVYEVSNTFGERHVYVAPADPAGEGPVLHGCDKRFYVSPFLDMDLAYEFRVTPPGARVAVAITARDAEGPVLAAALGGERRPLTDGTLLRACLAVPLLTLKVISGIHWEALRLFLKGAPFHRRPPPPAEAATVMPSSAFHATDA